LDVQPEASRRRRRPPDWDTATSRPIAVLLVEDISEEARLLTAVLTTGRSPSFDVTVAGSFAEAQRRLTESPVDVILLDLELPDANGLDTVRRMHAAAPDSPIVVLTGLDDEALAVDAVREGAQDYLVKARFDRSALVRAIGYAIERNRAEAAGRASERQLRALFDGALDAMVIVDDEGRCVQPNPAAGGLFGLPREQLVGRPLADFITEADLGAAWKEFRREGTTRGEFRVARPDGSIRFVEYSGTADVLPGRHLGVLRDITERKRAEEASRALAQVGRELAGTLDLGQAVNLVVSTVLPLFRVRVSALYQIGPHTGALICRATAGGVDPSRWVGRVVARGQSEAARAVVQGRTVRSVDFLSDPRFPVPDWLRERAKEDGFGSLVGVPLKARGDVVGALVLHDAAGRIFSDNELELLALFADQAALALENARLYHDARRRRHEAEELARTARRLTESLETSAVSESVVQSVLSIFGVTASILRFLQPDGSLVCVAVAGRLVNHLEIGDVLPRGVGVAGRAVAEGKAVWSSNVFSDPTVALTDQVRQRLAAVGNQAILAVPLTVKGEIIGALVIADSIPRPFTDSEVGLLQTFADQAALALENARLFEDARAARDFLSSIAENSADGIITTDVRGRITYFSPGAEEIFGYRHQEILGQPAADFYRSGIAEARAVMHRLHAEGRMRNYETAFRARDGRWVEVNASLSLLRDAPGAVVGTLGIISDVTERKKLEHDLRQSQKMEAVGRLAGGIAHDFNNLLTVITGRSELLLERLGPDEPLRRDIELFQKTADRAAGLTRQLLAFSRRQVLQPRVLDLNGVVTGLSAILRRLIGEDIDLVTELTPELGSVRADPGQIEQVIVNLVLNARDAMPSGGRLTIETANVDVDAASPEAPGVGAGAYATVAVSDTGVGMDPETRQHIFEPFFTTKPPGQGTGLGLATVYGIVEQSEGTISVVSEPGQGTTVRIYLPRVNEAIEAAPIVSAPPEPPQRGETVLLVEDEDAVRDLVVEILLGERYTVLPASDPGAALMIAERHRGPIHLLLTDVVMPQMSGRRLAEEITAVRPETKVIYISGYTDDAIVPQAAAATPAIAFLAKPFTPEGLASKIRDVLDAEGPG
jgi:two-component system cell cycle sensor histidine kinase/response regulator CckA